MTRSTKRCPFCGTEVPYEAMRCTKCKASLVPREEDNALDLGGPTQSGTDAQTSPKKRKKAEKELDEFDRWYDPAATRRKKDQGTWKSITVLAVSSVLIVAAAGVAYQLTKPVEEEVVEYSGVRVINADGEDITPTEPPEVTDPPEEEGTEEVVEEASDEEMAEDLVIVEMDDIVYVDGVGVRLRTGPSTTYDVAAVVANGTALHRTGRTTDGWSRVVYEGEEYYISEALISLGKVATEEGSGVTAIADTVTVTSDANARTGPGTGYPSAAVIPAGTELERTGTTGSWSQVVYNGLTLYVHNSMLDAAYVPSDSETQEAASDSSSSGGSEVITVTVTSRANIRTGPGTEYGILGVAEVGAVLTLRSASNSYWYQVLFDGQIGYVSSNMVKVN